VPGIVEVEAVSWACARTLAKLLEDDDPVPVDEVPVAPAAAVLVLDVLAAEGSNAV
jgi:hypothetical protein